MMRLLRDNIAWKLLSLALALALWLAFVRDPEAATWIPAPVQYRNLPKDLEMSSDVLERMHLEIRGPSGKLNPAGLTDVAVVLDLSPITSPGQRTFTIESRNALLPAGVNLVRAVPSMVRLEFERRVERWLPVEPRFSTSLPAGYSILRREVVPERLKVVGPESRVEGLRAAQTDLIDVGVTPGRKEFQVQVFLADPHVRFESSMPVEVRVEVVKSPPPANP